MKFSYECMHNFWMYVCTISYFVFTGDLRLEYTSQSCSGSLSKIMEHLHSNSVEQVRAKISLLRVEGGNEQRFAWVSHGDALA